MLFSSKFWRYKVKFEKNVAMWLTVGLIVTDNWVALEIEDWRYAISFEMNYSTSKTC